MKITQFSDLPPEIDLIALKTAMAAGDMAKAPD